MKNDCGLIHGIENLGKNEPRILIILREAHGSEMDDDKNTLKNSKKFFNRLINFENWDELAFNDNVEKSNKRLEKKYYNRFIEIAKKLGVKGVTNKEILSKIAFANITNHSGGAHIGKEYNSIPEKEKFLRIKNLVCLSKPSVVLIVPDLFDLLAKEYKNQETEEKYKLYGDKPKRNFKYCEMTIKNITYIRMQHPSYSERIL